MSLWLILLIIAWPTIMTIFTQKTLLLEWVLFNIYSTPIILTLVLDPIGITFSCTVLFISANVLRFSTIYMADDKFKLRFTILTLLFILSINLLIFLPHFIIILLGWDGLGITSFILIIYYQNPKSLAAGMVTALTNRVGDVILLLSIAWTLNQGHWYVINMWESDFSTLQIFCITIAAITKSAQIPFSRWLPAAIAAPTPVSALVHSSTLVTAGVFLLIRFYPFLHSCPIFNICILIIAVRTIVIAGLSAITECDIKKIIALSTLRQLGIIITSIGLNLPHLAFFHIVTHALFKSLLFVCAGSFINSHHHSQDLRWIGNLRIQIPVACACITLANLALCGFPFLAGFYSKDLIMEAALNSPNNLFMVILAMLRLGLTSFYTIRFSLVTMWASNSNAPFMNIKEYKPIVKPILALSIISIMVGSIISWIPPISKSIYLVPLYIKIMPIEIIILGVLLRWYIVTNSSISGSKAMNFVIRNYASCLIWFLVPLSTQFTIKWPTYSAHICLKVIDQGWLETISGLQINKSLIKVGNSIIVATPNTPSSYLITMAVSSTTLISLILIFLSC